jgi:hypothetical protein
MSRRIVALPAKLLPPHRPEKLKFHLANRLFVPQNHFLANFPDWCAWEEWEVRCFHFFHPDSHHVKCNTRTCDGSEAWKSGRSKPASSHHAALPTHSVVGIAHPAFCISHPDIFP